MALWGGRFREDTDQRFKAFNDSLRFDYRLALEDIRGSIAWAEAIAAVGVLTAEECAQLTRALRELHDELSGDGLEQVAGAGDEDIHSYVERRLIEKVGILGKKLHTGRSRNDQVALDLRLWCRTAVQGIRESLTALIRMLVRRADEYQSCIFPGFTHLQRAQPITFAHLLLAYVQMLERDLQRLDNAAELMNVCPLGAAALAGTAYHVDREQLALQLGFRGPTLNSLDAVADRDYVVELLSCASLSMVHLSRIAEDLVIYNSGEAALIEFSDRVTTGSSLMPQKKNPDAMELIRGKCGRVVGALTAMLMTIKALPLAYDKDLQEDKEGLFDAMETWRSCLDMATLMIGELRVNTEHALLAAKGGHANATELADYLVSKGIAFREAHELAGRAVLTALDRKCTLEELTLADFQELCPEIDDDVYPCLFLENIIRKRDITGGVAFSQTRRELDRLHHKYGS